MRAPGALAAGDPHAFFDALVARSDVFRAYSLRPRPGYPVTSPYYEKQLLRPADGGYAACSKCDLWITYAPAEDRDPEAQDAAKVVIPAFFWPPERPVLTAAASPGDTVLSVSPVPTSFDPGRSLRVDSEIMNIVSRSTSSVTVTRGAFGTAAAPHASGAPVHRNTNTVPNAVRVPMGTTDGHTYLFIWDAYWTRSYMKSGLTNHKTFNLISDGIWLEPGSKYDSNLPDFDPTVHVAELNVRGYGELGPGVTGKQPITPRVNFLLKPGVWNRYWIQIEQRAGDYDYMDMWIADETRDAVQTYTRIPLVVQNGAIEEFVLEWNTSKDEFVRGDLRDFVSYVRNVVVLRNAGDPTKFLQRPLGGAAPPGVRLSAPRNVRIVR
jgi:hypothetical protein